MSGSRFALRYLLSLGASAGLLAQSKSQGQELLELESLLNIPVEVAARGTSQRLADAPAVVSRISAAEIRALGYRSVGEALQSVPGFYVIDNLVAPSPGVRGINGGLQSYGNLIKVMIDGQPVAFRSEGSTFLGPELIPMEAVARIEVVRGPASSLYGANAFLGVINIITWRSEAQSVSGSLVVRGGLESSDLGLEALYTTEGGNWRLMTAVSGQDSDRSGLHLPNSSPILLVQPKLSQVASRNDFSRPRSMLISGRLDASDTVRLELLSQFSRLDAFGEFLGSSLLSHQNRLAVDQGFTRFKAELVGPVGVTFTGSLAYIYGGPNHLEHLDSGAGTTHPRRDVGYTGWDGLFEMRYLSGPRNSFVLGVDGSSERQRLMTVYSVDETSGRETAVGEIQGRKTFANTGLYAQGIFYPVHRLGLTANIRCDRHNIYGTKTTYRLGAVVDLGQGVYGKLLYGTSFKAPSAQQLYAQPLFAGEIVGNPALRAETARTVEAELGWSQADWLAMSLNLFRNRVLDRVELLPAGMNQVPTNTGLQDSHGVEAQAQIIRGAHRLTGSLSWQRTDSHTPDPFLGEIVTPTAMYPSLHARLHWQWTYGAERSLNAVVRHASERRATDSNILTHVIHAYALPATTLLDLVWNHGWIGLGGSRIQFQCALRNVLDHRFAEPGFVGVDLPSQGRQSTLSLSCRF